MSWFLEYNNVKKSFEDWGLSKLSRTLINQGKDRVTFSHDGALLDDEDLFETENPIVIYKDDVIWFQGIICKTPSMGSGVAESKTYEIAGPWWYLENLVFQQGWMQADSFNNQEPVMKKIYTGRIILGQDSQGNALTNGEQISAVVRYAKAQGAPIELGYIEVDVTFPYDETKDLSCAEAIQRLLRWSPDAVVWFDYSTTVPRINITRRKSMQAITIDESIKKLKVTPRYDLQSKSVVVKYEKNHNANGEIWTTTEVDKYPENATGREFKAIVLTVELQGARVRHVRQTVKSMAIDENNPHWWQRHLPAFQRVAMSDIVIKDASRNSQLPFELVEGGVAKWMDCEVEEDIVRAKISYKTEGEWVEDEEVAVKLHATDAQSRTYTKMLSEAEAEITPKGLAKQLWEGVSELHYEGEVVLEEEEVTSAIGIGNAINIGLGKDAWKSMRAVIQGVREDVDRGVTLIKFGPPKHLGADDLVELLRVNRRRNAPRNAYRRTTGLASGSEVIEHPTHNRVENTHMGGGVTSRLVIGNEQGQLVLDANDVKTDSVIKFCEEDVCEDGVIKKRLVFASEPYGGEEI